MQRIQRLFILLLIMCGTSIAVKAQDRVAQFRPYCDLRPFHLGVTVGTHMQDTELQNAGIQTLVDADGNPYESIVTADQNRWDIGFHVGMLGEMRIDEYFALRVAPTIYFGNRHFTFQNYKRLDAEGYPEMARQDMKTAYIGCDVDIIYAAKRFNNHRPYFMVGATPMLNLTTRANDYLQMKNYDTYLELGMGCDFYMPFFKLRPELKFMFGLGNSLNTKHADKISDPVMQQYAKSVNKATSKVIALTFYFE